MLSLVFSRMEATINALAEVDLRKKVKAVIDGGTVTDAVCKQVGAYAFGREAMDTVQLVKSYAEVKLA